MADGSQGVSASTYTLIVGNHSDDIMVHGLKGSEALSELYEFQITVTSATIDEAAATELLGQPAQLTINLSGATRIVKGVIRSVRSDGLRRGSSNALRAYTLTLVPRAWALGQRRDTRIFQDMRVDEVIDEVFAAVGVGTQWQVIRRYPPREYITQYEETDLSFVTRLLAEAGIFFFFDQGTAVSSSALPSLGDWPGETVIFADNATAYPPIDDVQSNPLDPTAMVQAAVSAATGSGSPTLQHHGRAQGEEDYREDHIAEFLYEQSVQTTATAYREYDPGRPNALLASWATVADLDDAGSIPPAGRRDERR